MNNDYGLARSKWRQYLVFSKDPIIIDKTPQTDLYSRETLFSYLQKYPAVFLKPIFGGKGQGIIKITSTEKQFIVQKGLKKNYCNDKISLVNALNIKKNDKSTYIVQQGLHLITLNRRPIDFRVHLMKKNKDWEVMGIMGKWAAKDKIVTNYSLGGMAITLQNALKRSLKSDDGECINFKHQLNSLGLHMANTHFNYARELGLDIGIDFDGQLWIHRGEHDTWN
jgi:hypothetical protein